MINDLGKCILQEDITLSKIFIHIIAYFPNKASKYKNKINICTYLRIIVLVNKSKYAQVSWCNLKFVDSWIRETILINKQYLHLP